MSTTFQSDKPSVVINDIPTSRLSAKVEAFQALFGTLLQGQTVKVKGNFKAEDKDFVFLREFKLVNLECSKRYWLCVMVDGKWQMIRANNDMIEAALIEAA